MSGGHADRSAAIGIVLVWALAVLPNLTVRSFIWEEGTNAELARDILVRGDFLEPSIYGVRWVEKPPLLPWLIAGVARLIGHVNEWSARMPAMLAVLVTALLVCSLTGRHVRPSAALFAAVCFLFCPLLLRKLTIAEPDTIVTALSFAAFVMWWNGEETGARWWRWCVCGAFLAAAAMAKGPQPIAFFALGVGGFLAVRRRWIDLPGFAISLALPTAAVLAWAFAVYRPGDLTLWMGYMRLRTLGHRFSAAQYVEEQLRFLGVLLLDLLPLTLLLPFLLREQLQHRLGKRGALVEALLWYASAATLVLFLWAGANTRYAMVATPAIAAAAGLAIDDLWRRYRVVVRTAAIVAVALFTYQLALVWVIMPLFADHFGRTRAAGQAIDEELTKTPAPAFDVSGPDSNQLFYVTHPVRQLDIRDVPAVVPPAWLLMPSGVARAWIEMPHADFVVGRVVKTISGRELVAIRLDRRPAP